MYSQLNKLVMRYTAIYSRIFKYAAIFICWIYFLPLTSIATTNPTSSNKTPIIFWHSMAGKLGVVLQDLAEKFNQSQNTYQIIPVYKGTYTQTLTATAAAFRAHMQPDIVQIYEIGTATMLHPSGIIVPVYQLMQNTHTTFNQADILAPIRMYYGDEQERLLAMPFNSSSPVLFYNKDAFKKVGLKDIAPSTWPQVQYDAKILLKNGYDCGFTTSWPSWIQLENFSAWHNIPFSSQQKNSTDNKLPKLLLNNPITIYHIQALADWSKHRIFVYGGREDSAMALFTSGKCPILFESSGSIADLVSVHAFKVGVGALPYWSFVKNAPQNTLIGGAALWALTGHSEKVYKGIAEFFAFLAKPETASEWQQATGYLPITYSAYRLSLKQGFYKKHPGDQVALNELLNKAPTKNSLGFRLGNYSSIRDLNQQYLEEIWSGKISAKQGIDQMVKDGDASLKSFAKNTGTS